MLPIQLEIKNFLAYRNPDPLYFEGIQLACLSGVNGAGKSSILDAITWVIWGKARSKSDDDLIHLGEDEMQVMLDFWQEGNRYRILRKRKRGSLGKTGRRGAGASELHLFAHDPDENVYRLLDEGSIRHTQERINLLLSLDYETFVNSAFLKQGAADAFTVKTAAQRKEILREILGLNRWLEYETTVKTRLNETTQQLEFIEQRLAEIDKEVAQEPSLQAALETAQNELVELDKAVDTAQERFNEVAGVDNELSTARSQADAIARAVKSATQNIEDAQKEIKEKQERLTAFYEVIERREDIETGYEQLKEAQEANQSLANMLTDLRGIEKRINELEKSINKEAQALEVEISKCETSLKEAEQQAVDLPNLEGEYNQLQDQIKNWENLEVERDEILAKVSKQREEIENLTGMNAYLKEDMNKLKSRLDMLGETTDPLCPTCGQALTDDHRQEVMEELSTEGKDKGDTYRANLQQIKELGEAIEADEASIKEINEILVDLTPARKELGVITQQIETAQAAVVRFEKLEKDLSALQERLAKRDFAHELQRQLVAEVTAYEKLGYDEEQHEAVRESLNSLAGYQEEAQALKLALDMVNELETNITNTTERVKRWEEELAHQNESAETVAQQIADLEVKKAEMELRREELKRQRSLQRTADEKRSNIQQQLLAIEQQREKAARYKENQDKLREQESVYQQLKLAFSRDGIPAMVIDAAIPEIEDTANRLLHKMTNGRMSVRFETQREKKTGGVAETFDIWISDELGQRDYSLYSGGEAFRVNFAIRVALSQLLARRAGAQLRTLFIDEGFGTQDEEGRARLTEAINAVQEDFDLILAITHIDELRDAFPVRIEIEKHDTGSTIKLR